MTPQQVQQDEELSKRDGKRRSGVREVRWVLRDSTRRKAEKRAIRDAEANGHPPPHDIRKVAFILAWLFVVVSFWFENIRTFIDK